MCGGSGFLDHLIFLVVRGMFLAFPCLLWPRRDWVLFLRVAEPEGFVFPGAVEAGCLWKVTGSLPKLLTGTCASRHIRPFPLIPSLPVLNGERKKGSVFSG